MASVRLTLSRWHLVTFLIGYVAAAAIAVRACEIYNRFAGVDKTPLHVALIAAATVLGPLVGPVANPGTLVGPTWVMLWMVGALALLLASLAPFIVTRHAVARSTAAVAWTAYLVALFVWFGAVVPSLGFFLS